MKLFQSLMYALFGRANREDAFYAGYTYAEQELSRVSPQALRARLAQLVREADANAALDNTMAQHRANGMYAAITDFKKMK